MYCMQPGWVYLFLTQTYCKNRSLYSLKSSDPILCASLIKNKFFSEWVAKIMKLRQFSLYCLVDELRQGCFVPRRRKKNKNKNLHFDSGRRKKRKSWKVTFFLVKLTNSIRIYAVLGKKSFDFWACRRKKMKCQFFFLVGHNFASSADLVN